MFANNSLISYLSRSNGGDLPPMKGWCKYENDVITIHSPDEDWQEKYGKLFSRLFNGPQLAITD